MESQPEASLDLPVPPGSKRILLTGASGYVSRNCLRSLASKGHEVHAVYFRGNPVPVPRVHWHQANLLDAEATTRLVEEVNPTDLLHMAWITTPGVYMSSLENFDWLQSSLHLLRVFQAGGGKRVVMAGSCFEYDWSEGYCREHETALAPSTFYGSCKDVLRRTLFALQRETGLDSAWGRMFFSYGPHEHPSRIVASVVRSLLEGKRAQCSPGTQIRDFMYIEDVAEAFVALLESDVGGPVNIASGRPVALKEIVETIAFEFDRPDLIALGALPMRPDEPKRIVADVTRLEEEVGFCPQYDLREGIRQTIRWWKSRAAVNGRACSG